MKKLLLFLCAALFAATGLAQTVTVGTGSMETQNFPIYAYYAYSYSQQIYTPAQITRAGSITKIAFYRSTVVSNLDCSNQWAVYMGHTTKESFASNTDFVAEANLTKVFDGTITVVSAGQWLEITLTTPFDYNNTQNLLLAVHEKRPQYNSINDKWQCTASPAGKKTALFNRSDYDSSIDHLTTNTTNSTQHELTNNLQLTFAQTGTFYVTETGAGSKDGSNWDKAMDAASFRTALTNATAGTVFYLAAGTYKPTAAAERNATFTLKKGVKMYGGFAGTETGTHEAMLAARTSANKTILSGDLNGDDEVTGSGSTLSIVNNGENVYHVVTGSAGATTADTELNGFTITGGNTAGSSNSGGGGMYNSNSSPLITNCTFVANSATGHNECGGGIRNVNSSSPTISNCSFINNKATTNGGGISNHDLSSSIINCTFSGNLAGYGGGMCNYNNGATYPTITNCTFVNNAANSSNGGGVSNVSTNPPITNCIFWGNTATSGETQIAGGSASKITYCVIQGATADVARHIIDTDPKLQALADNGGLTQTYALGAGSSAIGAGTATGAPATDQRGEARSNPPSIGAYDTGEIDLFAKLKTDINAANAANSASATTITLRANTTITATSDLIINNKNVVLVSESTGTVIDMGNNQNVQIKGASKVLIGSGIKIIGNFTDSNSLLLVEGGSQLQITNSEAESTTSGYQKGVSTLQLKDNGSKCIIDGNTKLKTNYTSSGNGNCINAGAGTQVDILGNALVHGITDGYAYGSFGAIISNATMRVSENATIKADGGAAFAIYALDNSTVELSGGTLIPSGQRLTNTSIGMKTGSTLNLSKPGAAWATINGRIGFFDDNSSVVNLPNPMPGAVTDAVVGTLKEIPLSSLGSMFTTVNVYTSDGTTISTGLGTPTLTSGASGKVSFTPTLPGDYIISVGSVETYGNVNIKIPVTVSGVSITTTTLPNGTVGSTYSQTLTAIGSTPITWSVPLGSLPAGLSLNANTGLISGTPTTEGTSTFTVTATNGGGSNDKQLSINIEAAPVITNLPPIAHAGLAQTVDEGASVTLNANHSYDPDGQALHYSWTAPEGIVLNNANDVNPSFTAPFINKDTDFVFSLIVTDGEEDSPAANVTITVKNVNEAPVANAGEAQTVAKRATVTLDGSKSTDNEGDELGYAWTAPEGITLSANDVAKPTFTAPEVEEDTEYTFTLKVSDGKESSEQATVVVTVQPTDQSLTANAGANQTVDEGAIVSLDGSASTGPEGATITYTWTAPEGITLSANNIAKPTFTAPEVDSDTQYIFSLTIHNGNSISKPVSVTVTVKDVNSSITLSSTLGGTELSNTQVVYHLYKKEGSSFVAKSPKSETKDNGTIFYTEQGEWIALASPVQGGPDFVPTYIGNTDNWTKAELVSVSAHSTIAKTIACIVPEPIVIGLGEISGYVFEDQSITTKSIAIVGSMKGSEPAVPGALVLLYKKGDVKPFAHRLTDTKGYYKFENLPVDEYEITIEIPGYSQATKLQVPLTEKAPTNTAFFAVNTGTQVITDAPLVLEANFSVRPNPVVNQLTISLETTNSGTTWMELYGINGSLVSKQLLDGPETTIDMSGYAPGIYLLKVTQNQNSWTKKLIKK